MQCQPAGPSRARRLAVKPRRYSAALRLITTAVFVGSLVACSQDEPASEIALPESSATEQASGKPTGEPTSGKGSSDSKSDEAKKSDNSKDDKRAGRDDGAGGTWIQLTDEPSGVRFAMPSKVEPRKNTATVQDGSKVSLRNYSDQAAGGDVEVGFNILDVRGASYDMGGGVDGVATMLDGEVVASADTKVDGHSAVDVEISYGENMLVLFRLIQADNHVLQTLVSGPQSDRETVEASYQRLNRSLEVN